MFSVEIEGVEEVRAAWASALGDIAKGLTVGVERGVEDAAAEARASHRYKDRTGVLTGSIRGYLKSGAAPVDGGEAVGFLEAKAAYASFVEEGTRPHEILPRRANFLRWEDTDGIHFAKRVQHPGGPSLPFMGPALQRAERIVEVEVELGIERAAERFR